MKRTIALTAAVLAALAVGTAPAWASDGAEPSCSAAILAATEARKTFDDHELVASDGSSVDPGRLEELRAKADDENDPNRDLAQEKVELIEKHQSLEGAATDAESVADDACRGEDGEDGRDGRDRDRHDRDHRHHDGRDHDSDDDDSDDDSDNSSDSDDDNDSSNEGDTVIVNNDVPAPIVSTSDSSNSDSIAVPTGGVATGVGPAK